MIVLAIVMLGRFLDNIAKSAAKLDTKDKSKPVNPNMSAPCPPHIWEPSKRPGSVYTCAKCNFTYPNNVETR